MKDDEIEFVNLLLSEQGSQTTFQNDLYCRNSNLQVPQFPGSYPELPMEYINPNITSQNDWDIGINTEKAIPQILQVPQVPQTLDIRDREEFQQDQFTPLYRLDPVNPLKLSTPVEATQGQYMGYPDLTTMVNLTNISIPVETQFVDRTKCSICGKRIQRDMQRHMRTHHEEARFKCCFPLEYCNHKSRKFNRPYDFKKHLLNKHFEFDVEYVKRFHNLKDKLGEMGTCPCGARFISDDWLTHVLRKDELRCPLTIVHDETDNME